MIKPLKSAEEYSTDFVASDIENEKGTGNILAIGTSWREGPNLVHTVHHSWEQYIDFLLDVATDDKKFRTIYAHNGGGWDWVCLCEYLLGEGKRKRQKISIARAQSNMIIMQVSVAGDFTLTFVDSLYLLRSSLNDLSKKLLGKTKSEDDIEKVWQAWHDDKPRFYTYLRQDCDLLVLVLEKTIQLLHETIAPIKGLGLTIGSTAMMVFKTGFLETEIETPHDEKVKLFLREGYRGGRVEVFKYGYHPQINVYDVNSLYPTAMITCEMPVSNRGDWSGVFRRKLPGCYRIKFKQRNQKVFPVLMVAGRGAYEGEGVYFTPEINLLREVDPMADIQMLQGYTFFDVGKPFDKYVTSLYNLRLSDPDGPISLLAKYLLNTLYGKFSQKSRREEVVIFHTNEEMNKAIAEARERGEKVSDLSPDSNCSVIERKSEIGFEHVGIAGMITSQARTILYRYFLKAGCENVAYCDTDSVHCHSAIPPVDIGTALGQVKKEYAGEGVYCGKKLYALRNRELLDTKKKEKVRAKGVTIGGRNGCSLSFDNLCEIANGAAKVCYFKQAPTVLQIIKGTAKSGMIGNADGSNNRKRTLRKTGV